MLALRDGGTAPQTIFKPQPAPMLVLRVFTSQEPSGVGPHPQPCSRRSLAHRHTVNPTKRLVSTLSIVSIDYRQS